MYDGTSCWYHLFACSSWHFSEYYCQTMSLCLGTNVHHVFILGRDWPFIGPKYNLYYREYEHKCVRYQISQTFTPFWVILFYTNVCVLSNIIVSLKILVVCGPLASCSWDVLTVPPFCTAFMTHLSNIIAQTCHWLGYKVPLCLYITWYFAVYWTKISPVLQRLAMVRPRPSWADAPNMS